MKTTPFESSSVSKLSQHWKMRFLMSFICLSDVDHIDELPTVRDVTLGASLVIWLQCPNDSLHAGKQEVSEVKETKHLLTSNAHFQPPLRLNSGRCWVFPSPPHHWLIFPFSLCRQSALPLPLFSPFEASFRHEMEQQFCFVLPLIEVWGLMNVKCGGLGRS